MNNSPWLFNFEYKRKVNFLNHNHNLDILIVGGGIAGVSTAYYLLKNTNYKIGVVDAGRIAHGATGHNAGQIVGYFERPFADIVNEFGLEKSIQAQKDINSAWELLDEIFVNENLKTGYAKVNGYAGVKNWLQAESFLLNKKITNSNNLHFSTALISKQYVQKNGIPNEYSTIFQQVDETEIWQILETNNTEYFAAFGIRKGVMNSASFCEEIITKLNLDYSNRLTVWEDSAIQEIVLEKDNVYAISESGTIRSKKVILCTNGFEHIKITNKEGKDVYKKFRKNVLGRIGYMAGYVEEKKRPPVATSYIVATSNSSSTAESDPYYYITRRDYEHSLNKLSSLVCIGGPEKSLPNNNQYQKNFNVPEKYYTEISQFLNNNFAFAPNKIDYNFKWHGLMGYTQNGIRVIGPEPENKNLLYNLGCNGIGILPSIFGGWKISQYLLNNVNEKSIFDPV
jgi:glycine/D-amino acid oxidase-like deaminating enzyme